MPEKDPLSYSLLTYVFVFGMSILGGVSSYISKIKGNMVTRFSITELLGEVVISGFVGIVTFYLCEAAKIEPILSAALIGISSHMGSRAIYLLEKNASRFLGKTIDINIEDNQPK